MKCQFGRETSEGIIRCNKSADKVIKEGPYKYAVCFKHFVKWTQYPEAGNGLYNDGRGEDE